MKQNQRTLNVGLYLIRFDRVRVKLQMNTNFVFITVFHYVQQKQYLVDALRRRQLPHAAFYSRFNSRMHL